MVPFSFRGVLYLDVFGWLSHRQDSEGLPRRENSENDAAIPETEWQYVQSEIPGKDPRRKRQSHCSKPHPRRPAHVAMMFALFETDIPLWPRRCRRLRSCRGQFFLKWRLLCVASLVHGTCRDSSKPAASAVQYVWTSA